MKGLLAFSAALTAFSALSLAMDRHYEDYKGRGNTPPPGLRRGLQLGGGLGLVLSLWAAIAGYGSAQGWVFWFGAMTVAALAVVLTLTYAPRRIARLLAGGGVLLLASALLGLARP
ncbi:DUF3325 domain-containing protein [Pseudorhodoferax sp. Leaf274]|uniref:DUF3325 domain-containing protein n=1 Tax=Pseudorhodoferax sp. Leaf274 TaxID=1736318 RepID=UPI0007028787|nr:DUF3325 domain-containing protein [Pseudorhodoferax sp. Leaf274]KQP37133.1 hypothetical protein ASF44_15635 [Pseudorhodoferax sp. Leaf274]